MHRPLAQLSNFLLPIALLAGLVRTRLECGSSDLDLFLVEPRGVPSHLPPHSFGPCSGHSRCLQASTLEAMSHNEFTTLGVPIDSVGLGRAEALGGPWPSLSADHR